ASDPTGAASVNLGELAEAINKGESKIGIGTKFLAWIKSWFGGDSYDTAIAKQAFIKITDEQRTVLLTMAFEAAIGPEGPGEAQNVQENVQAVLKFCQAVGIKAEHVAEAISSTPNFGDRKSEVVLDLANAGKEGAECLRQLLELDKLTNLPEFEGDEAQQLVLGLAGTWEGIDCLFWLFRLRKLTNLPKFESDVAKQLVLRLAGTYCMQPNGGFCLQLNRDCLHPSRAYLTHPEGAYCLRELLEDNKLTNLPKFTRAETRQLIPELVFQSRRNDGNGAKCVLLLLDDNKLTLSRFASDVAKEVALLLTSLHDLKLANEYGAECLRRLLEEGVMENLRVEGISSNYTKEYVLRLIEREQYGHLALFLRERNY
ncbi:MAG: hypothetical protein LBC11_02900, partial [Puniceicoccales bacterium]|nr:hypothetical protein [Puniceicoccales bacterium]